MSSSKDIFLESSIYYEKCLRSSGYKTKLQYQPKKENNQNKREKKRNIIWFNPPYSKSVKTNIGRIFIKLISKHFLPNHNSKSDTALSLWYWTLKQKQQTPRLTWEIKGQYKAYSPTLKKCNFFVNKKLAIIDDPDKNLLSKRSKVISQCRQRNKFKLVNLTSRKTPNGAI